MIIITFIFYQHHGYESKQRMKNVTYAGNCVPKNDARGPLVAPQHCGIDGYNNGRHGSLCHVHYLLEDVVFDLGEDRGRVGFGVSD